MSKIFRDVQIFDKGGVRLAVKVMLGLKGECLDKHVIYCFCFLTINDVETNEHHIFHKW